MKPMNEFPLLHETEGTPLFYPHVPAAAIPLVGDTLSGRWIGQGPKVDQFEVMFVKKTGLSGKGIAVSSGTAALHLAYSLAGVGRGDEVICPLFTCTATNLPIIYNGATPVFCDVAEGQLNVDVGHVETLVTDRTKAISVVDYGGLPCDYLKLRQLCDNAGIKLIADCAHALDGRINGRHVTEFADYTIYSFQAIKTLTTGDGGFLVLKNVDEVERAKRLRWFGIDRTEKQKGTWENDIWELGYKYQMNDIAASIGLATLGEIDDVLKHRRELAQRYINLFDEHGIHCFEKCANQDVDFTPWLITIDTDGRRIDVMERLRSSSIESAQVHYRNDRYSIFSGARRTRTSQMDKIEDDYLVLPLHTKMTNEAVDKIVAICAGVLNG